MFGYILAMFPTPKAFVCELVSRPASSKNTPAPIFQTPHLGYKVDMKNCDYCASDFPEAEFYPGLGWCKSCALEVRRGFLEAPKEARPRRTRRARVGFWLPETEESRRERVERWDNQLRARGAVGYAKKLGRLVPGPCVVCGTTEGVEAHHHLGYAREHWLDVEWRCRVHHRRTR